DPVASEGPRSGGHVARRALVGGAIDRHAGRDRGDHALHGGHVTVGGAEVGQERDAHSDSRQAVAARRASRSGPVSPSSAADTGPPPRPGRSTPNLRKTPSVSGKSRTTACTGMAASSGGGGSFMAGRPVRPPGERSGVRPPLGTRRPPRSRASRRRSGAL